jgi:glycosyltransferase involved in cell wall biosynthesis
MIQTFSIVLPAFNEEENLHPLMAELDQVLKQNQLKCEILLVDDGSTDSTRAVMNEIREKYPNHTIRIITLNGNYGLSTALEAGFAQAKNDVVASIDTDLQNDPADIPKLLSKLPEYDVAIGIRVQRKDDWVKRMSSLIANNFRNFVLDESWRDTGCSLKVYKKQFLDRIHLYKGMHRFLPTLLQMEGARVIEVEVNHRPRIHGKSKYHLWNRIAGPLGDLYAVRWMKKRKRIYRTDEN